MNQNLPVLSFLFTQPYGHISKRAPYLLRGIFIAILANLVFIAIGSLVGHGLVTLCILLLIPCLIACFLIKIKEPDMAIHVMSLGYGVGFIGSPWLIGRAYSPILIYVSIILVANLVFQSRRVRLLYFLTTFLSIYAYVLANTYTSKPQLPYIEVIEFAMLFFSILFIYNALSIFFKDIKIYKQQVKEREYFLEKIINTSPDAIFVKNNRRQYVLVNNKFTEVEGRPKETFLGKTALEIQGKFEHEKVITKEDNTIIRTKRPVLNKVVTGMENRRQLWFTYSKVPIVDDNQNVIGILGITRDITREKEQAITLNKKNAELQKYIASNMQLENFAHIASHDLREPIRSIVGFSQLLKRKAKHKLDKSENEYLDFVITASQNMATQIKDLLDYALVDSKTPKFRTFHFAEMLELVLKQLRDTIEDKKADIKYQDVPKIIMGNERQINQLFQNLISNAIKFSHPDIPPVIHINAEELTSHWQFSVSDNGIGILPEYHEKIFLLFRRLHTREVYHGTGIGLAICKKIVEQHKGKIWLTSEKERGTTFYFTIDKQLGKQSDSVRSAISEKA